MKKQTTRSRPSANKPRQVRKDSESKLRQARKQAANKSRQAWKWIGLAVPVILFSVLIAMNVGDPVEDSGLAGQPAPEFALPATNGDILGLDDVIEDGDALLYFSMGVGCDGCFAQIPEAESELTAAGIRLVPIMVDPPDAVAAEASRFGISSPILIDRDRQVSASYDMLGVYGHTDRPSHSFTLVHSDGTVGWMKHYSTMFVPADQLIQDMLARA